MSVDDRRQRQRRVRSVRALRRFEQRQRARATSTLELEAQRIDERESERLATLDELAELVRHYQRKRGGDAR